MKFSQNNEEDLILAYFGSRVGTFLDIGANDGSTLSNTHALALLGWEGVCVEPSPTAFAKLSDLYKGNGRIELHNVAIDNDNGRKILHESGNHIGREDFALLSTIVPTEMDRWKGTKEVFKPVAVECVTFLSLLESSKHAEFDMISIDAEGLDFDIVSQIDLRQVNCSLLVVEYNGKEEHRFVQYCREYGMNLRHKNGENLLFSR